ncbi:class I SAM-dependent methyltransferase [Litchfieldia salsa]|uniref:Methyltransferase domain-containing protein n=1 Tax=Litchfieldia salsa TaxID=930152 RepID=A0A1H0VEN8_9BACI|nr:class I SAM-dependent methyltransferase [Litchfieldia salsa]SDP77039.1 Methyltransferase domain-containing protein [Litchfieldia salsa]
MDDKIGIRLIGTAKQTLKMHRTSKNPFIRLGISILYTLSKPITEVKRFLIDKNFRSIILMRLLNSKNVHQTTSLTYMNRYPTIFSACRDFFEGKQDIKILSYGCSTGEEVLTLRHYFPHAKIVGADVNKSSLAICKKLSVDNNISFVYSNPNELEKHGPFDVIFCMAVLQRQPHYIAEKGITSLKKIYPFEKFEKQIIGLDHLLNSQGLLVIHYTQYSLLDTVIASKYEPLGNYNQDDYNSPIFDKNSNIRENTKQQNTIYIKSGR